MTIKFLFYHLLKSKGIFFGKILYSQQSKSLDVDIQFETDNMFLNIDIVNYNCVVL